MGFPRSLTMDETALYVLGNFEGCRSEVVFPPGPLPYNYEELCPDFNLTAPEEYTQDFEVPELPQVVFLAMLLNDAVKLKVLRQMDDCGNGVGPQGEWMGRNKGRIKEARRQEVSSDSEEEANLGSDSKTSRSSGDSYLSLTIKEYGEAHSIGYIEQIFLTSVRKREIAVIEGKEREKKKMILFPNFSSTEMAAEYIQDTFRWRLRETSALHLNPHLEDYHGLCPGFDLGRATQFAHNSNISKMVQAIFYAMVLNDVAELGLLSRLSMDCMM
ncbi:hypothetical protein Cgig2_017473 [Carnegiea gigantea]|uniref:Uncharacterized protein n=1 Tax=Carnegiea gigantea TaxID=171969 RepID=A0A9Q1JJG2_9CARY|nr:hypothetical protein Cgig2_017473 [Carnegiea gigantea]